VDKTSQFFVLSSKEIRFSKILFRSLERKSRIENQVAENKVGLLLLALAGSAIRFAVPALAANFASDPGKLSHKLVQCMDR